MGTSLEVLCYGKDPLLLRTRTAVVSRKFAAVSVDSLQAVQDLPTEPGFDVVVLCHSIPELECLEAIALIRRRWPEAAVLALTGSRTSLPPDNAVTQLQGLAGPEALLAALRAIRAQRKMPALSPA